MKSRYILGLVPLVAAAYIGCGKKEQNSQSPQKISPPISQVQRSEQVSKKYSPEELLALYQKFVPKANDYNNKIEETVYSFAKRSGIDPSQVARDDYDRMANPILSKMKQDSDIKTILDLEQTLEISGLATERLDMDRTRRIKGILFMKGDQPLKARYDPELTLPISPVELTARYFVNDPLVYQTLSGKESVKVDDGHWAHYSEFGEKPGKYVRESIARDIKGMKNSLSVLSEFIKKVKPDASDEFVNALLDKEPKNVRDGIYTALLLGEGHHQDWEYAGLSQLRYRDHNTLQTRGKELKEAISTLEKILAIK